MTKSYDKPISNLVLTILIVLNTISLVSGQEHMDLDFAINTARKQSLSFKVAVNSHQGSKWDYLNYIISRKPLLYLDGTIPNYVRSINKITLPNGDDSFVTQNQSYSSLYLNLRQQIAATGGTLAVGTSVNRIDIFGNNRSVNYSAVPFSISYTQNTVGYNDFKWLKKIEPLRLELADRKFVSDMEDIAIATIDRFFGVINLNARKELSEQNLKHADTLLSLANERYKLGTVGQSDLLQLQMNLLNARKQLSLDSVDLVMAGQSFSNFLTLHSEKQWHLLLPTSIVFFPISYNEALTQAQDNSKEVIRYRLDRISAEKALAQTKAENKLKFNIYTNLGFSKTAENFSGLLNGLENQQNLSIGFGLPILDWGSAKTRRLRAEANLAMVESQIDQQKAEFEQEVRLQVARWNLQQEQVSNAEQSKRLALENYEMEKERFLKGSVSINDLNIAQMNKDNMVIAYNEAIRNYWMLYYVIRKLTLFDFQSKKPIKYTIED